MKSLLSFISILALSLQCASAISSLTLDTLSFKTLVNGTTINDFPIVSADVQTLGFDSAMRGPILSLIRSGVGSTGTISPLSLPMWICSTV